MKAFISENANISVDQAVPLLKAVNETLEEKDDWASASASASDSDSEIHQRDHHRQNAQDF